MSSEFTIVIPYYAISETIDFVKRQLNYYHFNPTPMTVILAVSGDEIATVELEQFIKGLNDSRFVMFTTEETDITNMESWLIKIFDGLKRVTTPYVVINGADDVVIPEAAHKGTDVLANNLDTAAVKGHTVYFDNNSGKLLISEDLDILDDCPINRLKDVMEYRDSFFYIIRRTKDLVREFENIVGLSKKPKNFHKSSYHLEHFNILSIAALGKVYVFKLPWRIQISHKNNSTSYSQHGFDRIELGALDMANYQKFKSGNINMQGLSYAHYKFLWVYNQIKQTSLTLEQIGYRYIYKSFRPIIFARIFTYFLLHKIFIFSKKLSSNESMYLNNPESFFKTEEYSLLKKYYFSAENIKLIESKNNIKCKS